AESAGGGDPTATGTSGSGLISLTSMPTSGDGRVIARRIYRTKADGSVYFLLATIPDNSATTYTDNTHDSALGDPGLTTSTADNAKMSLTSIATGPSGTVKRNLYRTDRKSTRLNSSHQ